MGLVRDDDGQQFTARRGLIVGSLGVAVAATAVLWPTRTTTGEHGGDASTPIERDAAWMLDAGIAATEESDRSLTDPVTREEVAVYLYRLAGSPNYPAPEQEPYRDVTAKSTNFREILWMRGQAIAFGAFDATFRPTELVSRGEMCAFLSRMLHVHLERHLAASGGALHASIGEFSDVHATHRYARSIQWARECGLIDEVMLLAAPAASDGEAPAFHPDADLQRGHLAHLLRGAEGLFA